MFERAHPTGLGSGENGINVWGSVAIPRRRTLEELDFSQPSKPQQTASAPTKSLPSGDMDCRPGDGGCHAHCLQG